MEYRFRISKKEREFIIKGLRNYVLCNYFAISLYELKEYLKIIIKFITFDRKYRRAFEERIDKVIEKISEGKIKEAEEIIKTITIEYEKEKQKIEEERIIKSFNSIEKQVYEWLIKNKSATEEELQDYFFSTYVSRGFSRRKVYKAYNRFFDKLYKLGFKEKIARSLLE
ncbi:MAG: hypothetical protein QXX97_05135, partial [Nitrososphaerota archaeon]